MSFLSPVRGTVLADNERKLGEFMLGPAEHGDCLPRTVSQFARNRLYCPVTAVLFLVYCCFGTFTLILAVTTECRPAKSSHVR